MKRGILIIVILTIVAIILGSQSLYIVNESEQAIVTEFGKPVGEPITEPGIHIKKPFIQDITYFDKRYLEWDGDPGEVPTNESKYIYVDTYARWQIVDPLQFFKRVRSEKTAQSRLDDILDGETRNVIGQYSLKETLHSFSRETKNEDVVNNLILAGSMDSTSIKNDSIQTKPMVRVGRQKIQNMVLNSSNEKAKELGIAILDFRFKRINYSQKVQEKVYDRMKTERYKIADSIRSEGQGEASRINGEKERELLTIQSEAFKTAEEIKGKADAQAAAIYSSAYNQSFMSKDLYKFLKSMETLEKSLDTQTSIILSTDSELFKYLKDKD